jgi:hypothetical protein
VPHGELELLPRKRRHPATEPIPPNPFTGM